MWTLALILLTAACLGGVAWLACSLYDAAEDQWFGETETDKARREWARHVAEREAVQRAWRELEAQAKDGRPR